MEFHHPAIYHSVLPLVLPAYYGSPLADKELKANKMFISGGAGYRNAGMFIDLTYTHALQKDVNFPYRLSDKANTFATTKTSGGGVMLTVGFKIWRNGA